MFYTLVLHVFGKVLVKSRGQFGVFKYNTFCLLTRIYQSHFHKNGLLLTLCWIKMHIP